MRFEFATAQRILFGTGTLREGGKLARELGSRPFLVTGRRSERSAPLRELLEDEGLHAELFSVPGEPTVALAQQGAERARAAGCDLVIAIGGGSALDAGKAIAALAANPGDPLEHLEVIGRGRPIAHRPLPCIAIPTTAGTGSEVTRNAVLASPEHGVKASLRHPWMLPNVALVDPELTRDLSPEVTAATGLDALTQLIEPYVSSRANPLTDAICLEGIRRVARALRRAYSNGNDMPAREDMALASLFGGLALANAGLGAVHGLAAPLGGMKPVPHGVACAALLPFVMSANIRALREHQSAAPALARYLEIAQILTGDPEASAEEGATWVIEMAAVLRIPRLSTYGLTQDDLAPVAERAALASSMQANPIKLDAAVLASVMEKAL